MKNQIEPIEAKVKCKDGLIRFIEFQFSSIGTQHLVTFIDLTKRKWAESALLERERHSQSLLCLSRSFEQAQTYADVLNAAQEEVEKMIGYKNLWAYLFTPDKKHARVLHAKGPLSDKVMSIEGIATIEIQGDRMMEEFVESKEILVVEDAQTDERTNKELARKMGNRTLVNIPILLFDRHMGSVGVGTFGDEGVRVPTQLEKEYLSSLASHMAVTLDRIHLLDKRRQMEEDLAAREREFRTLAEYSPDNIARYDINCQTIYVNPTLEKTLGRPASEMLGTFPAQAGFINEANEYQEKINEVISTGKEQELDLVLPDMGEGVRYHNIRFVAERGANGVITGIQAIGRDITERKRMEEALSASEAELRTLINSMPDVIFVGNSEGRFLKILDTSPSLLYIPSNELLGKTLHEVFPKDQADFFLRNLRQALDTQKPVDFEYNLMIGEKLMWFYATVSPMTNDRTLMVARNVTDLKQAEEKLRLQSAALEAAANGFMITDQSGNINWVNPAFTRLTGYTFDEVIGKNPNILKSGKQSSEFYETLWNTIRDGKVWQGELVNRRKNGSLYTEEMTIASLRGENGETTHFIAVKQDISERKRHEREREAVITVSAALRQATSRVEILSTILDQMSALFDAGGTFIALPHAGTGDVIIEMGRGPIGEKFNGLKIPHGMGVSGWVIMNKRSYLNNSANVDPIFYRPDLLDEYHCVASVPLIAHEKSIGALWIARRNYISEQDLQLLNAVADIAANAIHRITLHEQTEQQLHHLLALHQIDVAITTNFDLSVTLNIILMHVKTELAVDAASILLLNPLTDSLEYAAGLGFKTENIKSSNIKNGDGISGRAAFEYHTVSCPDLKQGVSKFSRSSLLADEEFASHFATPLLLKRQSKGVLEVFHRTILEPDQDWLAYFETLATQAVIAIENATLLQNLQLTNEELIQAYDATIEGWSRALDLRDHETEGHTQRVTEMSLELADKMGMSEAEKANLRRGALLHDIGKMGVPDSILHKPGKLTDSEWEIMRQHPSFAYQMLSPITYLKHAIEISYCHHEKWDGTGYPHGLKGEEIPLAARVFAVVDVFDALTSDRPYRRAWSDEESYRYIQAHSGTHFDPQVVKVFLENK